MKIDRQQVGTVQVFAPVGALVDEEAAEFTRVLLQDLDRPDPRVVLAMQEVPYMDSQALEGLVKAANDMQDRSLPLKVACLTGTCREILALTGVADHFQLFEDVPTAVRSFL